MEEDLWDAAAADVLQLAASMQNWVTRRSERVTFIDHTTVKRQIELDLELPRRRDGDVPLVLPIGRFMTGVTLGIFNISDDSGRRLTMLNRRDNIAVTTRVISVLTAQAAEAEVVSNLAKGFANDRETAAVQLLEAAEDEELARSVLVDLVDNYLMLVRCPVGEPPPRALIVTYEEPLLAIKSARREQTRLKKDNTPEGHRSVRERHARGAIHQRHEPTSGPTQPACTYARVDWGRRPSRHLAPERSW